MGLTDTKLLFLLTFISFPSASSTKAVTCVAGEFDAGATAYVTCVFPDDLENHENVYIRHHPFGASDNSSEVLLCKVEELRSSTCTGKGSYFLKKHTRNTVTAGIPNVTTKAAGQYTCQFLPHYDDSDGRRDMCDLNVHAQPGASDNPHPATTDQKADSSDPQEGTSNKDLLVGVIVAVVIAVIITIAVVAIFIYRCKSQKRQTNKPKDSGDKKAGNPLMGPEKREEVTCSTPRKTVIKTVESAEDSGLGLSGITSPGTSSTVSTKANLSQSLIETEGESFKLATIETPISSNISGKERDPAFLLARLCDLLERLERKTEDSEAAKADSAMSEVASSYTRISEGLLQHLVQLQQSGSQQRGEPEGEKDSVKVMLKKLAVRVERGEVDEEDRKAIKKMMDSIDGRENQSDAN